MAKVKVLGSAAVITSTISVKDFNTLKKFKPTALKLIDKETKDELFAMSMSNTAHISKFGINFTNADNDGFAQVTIAIPTDLKEDAAKKTYIADNFGYALLNMNKLEAQVEDIMAETAEEFEAINGAIETL